MCCLLCVAGMNYPCNQISGIRHLSSDLCFLSSDIKLRVAGYALRVAGCVYSWGIAHSRKKKMVGSWDGEKIGNFDAGKPESI